MKTPVKRRAQGSRKAEGGETKPPSGKPPSARATKRDWAFLLDIVTKDSKAHPILLDVGAGKTVLFDFDERYVDAILKALHGRDNRPLLDLLRRHEMIHPVLLPALADVIESQRDGAVGVGARLTAHDDQIIRQAFDKFVQPGKVRKIKKSLQDSFHVSEDTIDRSLKRTKSAK